MGNPIRGGLSIFPVLGLLIARDAVELGLPNHRPAPDFRAADLARAEPRVDRPDADATEIVGG
jgi:hypothetical protein